MREPVRSWICFAIGCMALLACQRRKAPVPRARASIAPAAAVASSPAQARLKADMQRAIAADRANEFQKLSLFLNFVKSARKAPEEVSGVAECQEAGLCSKIYAEPGLKETWLVSYAKAQATAFRVQAVFGNVDLSCSDLGTGSVIRSWQYGSSRKHHCALSAGPLAGLQAVLENYPGNARVIAFSKSYLERDAAFKAVVESEGATAP